jgi:hypothetical protein
VVLAASCVLAVRPAQADDDPGGHQHGTGNVELFLSLQTFSDDGPNDSPRPPEDMWGNGDLVFAGNRDRWRALGEYHFGPHESDMERLQVGFEPVPDTLVWLGRFHQPGSAWNNEFHHGQHLQTTITRPSIEFWEDEEGLVPQHLTGALFESRRPLGSVAGLQFAAGLAYGSIIDADGLSPVDLLRSNPGSHRLSETARISFLPQYLGSSSAGILYGHHRTPVYDPAKVALLAANLAHQHVYGAYVNHDREPWRAIAAAYYIDVDLQNGAGGRREHFGSGYVQVERQLSHGITLFARHEDSANARTSRYVRLQPDDFVAEGNLGGLRWEFRRHQALTVELSRLTDVEATHSVARLQWSSVFP